MSQNFQQFTLSAEKGFLANGVNNNILALKIKNDSTSTFGPGTAVKLVNVSGYKDAVIDKAAAGDTIFGFIAYRTKRATPVAGEIVDVAFSGSFMRMEAGAAINAGASVEIVASGDKVVTLNTNTKVGVAMKSASATGDIITVLITTPGI